MQASSPIRGRSRETATVGELIRRDDVRLVTLTGLAGVGKTRVLEHALDRAQETVEHVTIVRVDPVGPEGVLSAVADAADLDVNIAPDVAAVAEALDAASAIAVVDGAHAAPDAGDVIGELLASTESARFVVTHRVPLGIAGECVVRIGTFPPPPETGAPADDPGVQLFVDVAATVGVDVPDDARTRGDVAAICARLGGLPGAIELAALRSAAFSPSTMRKLLDVASAREVLSGPDGDGWFAAESWIESLVEPDQRRLIRDMAVFRGPVPIDAVFAVTGLGVADAVDRVGELVDMHLLDADHSGTESTYVLPRLVREHAEATADPRHDDRLAAARARWALDVVAGVDLAGAAAPEVALVERDLVAVLHSFRSSADAEAAATIAVALGPLWLRRGVSAREAETMARVAAIAMADHGVEPGLRALAIGWSALFGVERAMIASDIEDVVAARDEALALADEADEATRLAVLGICVQIARVLDDRAVAVRLCEDGLALARLRGDDYNRAQFELWSGMLAHQDHRIDDAVAMGEAAFGRARRLGEPALIVRSAGLLATLPPTAGVTVSLPAARELVELARELDDQRSLLWLRPTAADEALRVGDPGAAASLVVDHLVAARAIAAGHPGAISLLLLVQLAVAAGDDEGAAWVHGVVASHLELLRPGLPPHVVEAYDLTIESLRSRLCADRLDALAAQGSLLSMEDTHAQAIAYARSLAEGFGASDGTTDTLAEPLLTARESEVLARLVEGDTNKDIARRLGITPKTAMHHTSSIYRKLGVRGRTDAVAWALRGPDHPAA